MASLSESSTPQSPSLPYPPGESKLELTPTEVLGMIFSQLSQNDLQSFLDLKDQTLVEANRAAHANMRSLCLTSKRIDGVARPLLFRNITITSPTNLLMLYESLYENYQLGLHLRQLSFEIMLEDVKLGDFFPLRSSQAANLLIDWDKPSSQLNSEEQSTYCCDQFLSSAYFGVLRRTPRVHRLVLRIQLISFLYDEDEDKDFEFMYEPFFRRVRNASNRSAIGVSTEFLPQLKTLELLGDPENPRNMFDYLTCGPLLRLRTLDEITLFQAWNCFGDAEAEDSGGRLEPDYVPMAVRVANIQDCAYLSREFRFLGDVFPKLECLNLSIRMDDWYNIHTYEDPLGHQRFADLQGALTQMKSLHTLIIEVFYLERDVDIATPPTNGPSLASLPRLETLKFPMRMLVERDSTAGWMMDDRVAHLFPKSLRHLILTVEVRCLTHLYDVKLLFSPTCTSSSTVIDFIETLSRLGPKLFPNLEEVVCCYSMKGFKAWPEFEKVKPLSTDLEVTDLFELDVDSSQSLEQLRTLIQSQKMRFSVAYEGLYCQCQNLNRNW